MASTPASLQLRPVFVADDSQSPLQVLAATEEVLLIRQGVNYSILHGELPAKEGDDCRIQNLPPGMIGRRAKAFSFLDKQTLCVINERNSHAAGGRRTTFHEMIIIRATDGRFKVDSLVSQQYSIFFIPFVRVASLETTADGVPILTTRDIDHSDVAVWRLELREETASDRARVYKHLLGEYEAPQGTWIPSAHSDGHLLALHYFIRNSERKTVHQIVRDLETEEEFAKTFLCSRADDRLLRVVQGSATASGTFHWKRRGKSAAFTLDYIEDGELVGEKYEVSIPLPVWKLLSCDKSKLIISGDRLFYQIDNVILMGYLPHVVPSLQEIAAAAVWRGLSPSEQRALLNTRRCSNRQLLLHALEVADKRKLPLKEKREENDESSEEEEIEEEDEDSSDADDEGSSDSEDDDSTL